MAANLLMKALKFGAVGAVALTGLNMVGKLFGNDPDFTQAWMMRRMSGDPFAMMNAMVTDGFRSMFLGSRTMSAMTSRGGFGAGMYGHMGMMGMMNPAMMGMPYNPAMMGMHAWGAYA